MNKEKMNGECVTIGLISHYFRDTNLGCTALSICNVLMLDEVAASIGKKVKYVILVNEKQPHIELDFTNSEYEYRVYPSTKRVIKNPFKILFTDFFRECDLVLNICAGDGFTDIYGKWRTFSESYMVITGHWKGYRMILAPQTIGPFTNVFCRMLARYMMNQCEHIYVRDNMSYNQCVELGQKNKVTEVIDVALALPFSRQEFEKSKVHVGINVSGLLYNNENNQFGLTLNYRQFIDEVVEYCLEQKMVVHLISHVIIPGEMGEDDFHACKVVHEKYPETVLAPVYDSPIDIKGYIAGLDIFLGARMHATIGAISSGVPVIPFAYSRKVNGLYGNLEYPYYIDAKNSDTSVEDAVKQFVDYLENIDMLRMTIPNSKKIYERELKKYIDSLRKLLETV